MVLLTAAVCTKQGKVLVSRQFVEMSRPRIEGLLAAFPKLMTTGKQHTFVETENVRYVYQPLERLYVLLITTKASNILEDLETLRLFSRVVPEYCSALDEEDVIEHCFDLIFAFDEIVALGYRENVNLAQIRTFTEMNSHDENVYEALRKSQEKDAKEQMKKKVKELRQAKREAQKYGGRIGPGGGFGSGSGSGIGSSSYGMGSGMGSGSMEPSFRQPEPSYKSSRAAASTKAMKLGKKNKDVDSFVDKIISEGGEVSSLGAKQKMTAPTAKSTPASQQNSVHLKLSEKITVVAGRDGGVDNMEVTGMMQLRISDQQYGRIQVYVEKDLEKNIQLQTHPNVDKNLFSSESIIAMKQEGKSFPLNNDIGVLKWRFQTTSEDMLPLKINCWPSEVGGGNCEVNIEYELQKDYMELMDVFITIPLPPGVGAPVVGECEGEYTHDPRKHTLQWHLPVVDASNNYGSMEFTIAGIPDDFFPVSVVFVSSTTFCTIKPNTVKSLSEDGEEVKFSSEVSCLAEHYEFK